MIDVETASRLLDFGRGLRDEERAKEQLHGAVALFNILKKHRVAYLADEVGMGKTFIALGVAALMRHYQPSLRVCIIAPRQNIQEKWHKDAIKFTRDFLRFDDLRNRGIDQHPVRSMAICHNLLELTRETTLEPDRDFLLRMTSFSLPISATDSEAQKMRDALRQHLPWLSTSALDLRNRDEFKLRFASAISCSLPEFDLLIVDESHNLRRGVGPGAASRNLVMSQVFGCDDVRRRGWAEWFPGYRPKAKHILMLSATPIEESYHDLWNQLDLFKLGGKHTALCNKEASEEQKQLAASDFLIRRVKTLVIANERYTKNRYRREWRQGGMREYDQAMDIQDPRQRLIVALVQKKVSEILSGKRFNHSFQIGMLASFESFLETAKLKSADGEPSNFDDSTQSESQDERLGADVPRLNQLARSYRKAFGHEMPHPKMDAIVDGLAPKKGTVRQAWETGAKTLIFVRRVASVLELKRKLDERYDDWLIPLVRSRIPPEAQSEFDVIVEKYREQAQEDRSVSRTKDLAPIDLQGHADVDAGLDEGGTDTFFAWFFRGEGPRNTFSGAALNRRFAKGAYETVFLDHPAAIALGVPPVQTLAAAALAMGLSPDQLAVQIEDLAADILRNRVKSTSVERFEAVQRATLQTLSSAQDQALRERAQILLDMHGSAHKNSGRPRVQESRGLRDELARKTFFSQLEHGAPAALRRELLPDVELESGAGDRFRSWYLARFRLFSLLSAVARLGHASIDLFLIAMQGRRTFQSRDRTNTDEMDADAVSGSSDVASVAERFIHRLIDELEQQRQAEPSSPWGAFAELRDAAQNAQLIMSTNLPGILQDDINLSEVELAFSRLLRQQKPIGGMHGEVNKTLVGQFRMPGYPLVLITTDILQEGEDLHTFCSRIVHYGISWTPSSMEQRIGRIDRVCGHAERRLREKTQPPCGDDLLQVYYPHLRDTIEVLQVERVLRRMDDFLRRMHKGLAVPEESERRLDVAREILVPIIPAQGIKGTLETAFPIQLDMLPSTIRSLAVEPDVAQLLLRRFAALKRDRLGECPIIWSATSLRGRYLGTAHLPNGRIQPFTLILSFLDGHPAVRCISPVGLTDVLKRWRVTQTLVKRISGRIGALPNKDERSYDLTVEDDVLLVDPKHDLRRVSDLVERTVRDADILECAHWDDRDEALEKFAKDLEKDHPHVR